MNRRAFLSAVATQAILIPRIARAQFGIRSPAFVGALNKPSVAQSYLMNEGFESGTAPSGWTAASGVRVYNTSTSGLSMDGSYCLAMTSASGSTETQSADIAGQTEIWAYFKFRTTNLVSGCRIAALRDSGGNRALELYCPGGGLRLYIGGGSFDTFTDVPANDTTYHFWMHWKSNGTGDAGFSTDGVRPTSGNKYKALTGGSGVTSVVRIVHSVENAGTPTDYWDTVRLKSSQIGDSGV